MREKSYDYDVIVIGAGPGGYVAAIRLGQLGKRVLVVEKQYVGGVCLNVGCIPTKALLHAAHLHAQIQHARKDMGFQTSVPEVDLDQLNRWKEGIVQRLVRGIQSLWKANGVSWIRGEGRLVDAHTVRVSVPNGDEDKVFRAEHILLATGSRPVELPGFEVDGERIWNSNHAVSFPRVPRKLLVLGAGAIGLEFAYIYRQFGAEVDVLELMDQILPGMDRESAGELAKALRRQGIRIHLGVKATSVEKKGEGIRLVYQEGEKEKALDGDVLLVAVGRRPVTEGLGLDAVGLQVDKRGYLPVDSQRRTKVSNIFAIGDLTGPPLLAHKASREGVVAAEVIAGQPSAFDPRAIPAVVYTEPQLASVGMTEEEAKARGMEVAVGKFPWLASGRALTYGETVGFAKIVVDRESDVVVGVHIVGPEASSLIGEGVLAVEMGATAEDIGLSIHPHPTLSEALMEAAENVHKRAIHILNR